MNRLHTVPSMATANGIDIAYQSFGEEQHPCILLIMGLGSQMQTWHDGFCSRLADCGYRVVRFDNRDCGQSSVLDNQGVPNLGAILKGQHQPLAYTLKELARDAIGLLDFLHIERAHVVGASMGGMIAQLLAIDWPKRLHTLTAIMSSSGRHGLPGPTPEAQKVLFTPPPLNLTEETFVPFFVNNWRVVAGNKLPFEEDRIRELASSTWQRGYHPTGIARQFAAMVMDGDRTQRLAKVGTPTLVIHGGEDPLIPPDCGRDIADAVPGAQFHLIEGMGHDFPISCWDELVGTIVGHTR
ncbi:MAG: alpha/beta fold hydrolase [Motiliproteus sp.]|nr:alpha/beta fold hydrolase [Motiliproteus sp.]